MSFLVQPINQAMAANDDSSEDEAEVSVTEVRPQEDITESIDTEIVDDSEMDTNESAPEEVVGEIGLESDTDTDTEDVTDENEISIDDETDENASSTIPSPSVDESEQQLDIIDQTVSTTPTSTVVVQAQNLVTDSNYYQFSRQSCVEVGAGAYHCSVSDVTEYDTQAVVYAAAGAKGNSEIFLKTARGEAKQITDNDFDDTAPHYDAESLQVVWQRLIDDRYQIISYDISTGRESQLTYSRTNNMEPKVSKDGIVWQAWDNNDWEIMYFDGKYTEQITDNAVQDVSPVIQDKYILWSVIGRSSQEAKVYSLKSKETMTISGHEGGTIVNPRFVLVYDTKFDNGDVITQGFDPVTGVSAPIAAKPAPEPVNIPPIDPIGEIRALINNKSVFEDEHDFELEPDTDDTIFIQSSSSATDVDTLNLKPGEVTVMETTSTSTFILTEYDLVITGNALAEQELNTQE